MVTSVLSQPTLVLNRNWQPVHVANVQRALRLLFSGAACVVDPENYQVYSWDDWSMVQPQLDEPAIRTVALRLKIPEVLVLTQFDRLPKSTVSFSKRNVFKRDRYTCQYCGVQPSRKEFTIDHVVPRALGGQTTWENCVLACMECNHRKADLPLPRTGMKLRRTPDQPAWRPLYSAHNVQRKSWKNFISTRPAVA